MAIIEFIKQAGERILDRGAVKSSGAVSKRQQQQQFSGSSSGGQMGAAARSAPSRRPIGNSREASHALLQYIRLQDALDVPDDLVVVFDMDSGLVSLEGNPPDQETREMIVLLAGNVEGVESVDDGMTPARRGPRSDFYTVKEGETAASIAQRHYGDERLARRILMANRPILDYTCELRQGQTIRLPEREDPRE
jgi:nucleoid-associated protein YgaU